VDRSLVINADDFGYDPASADLVLELIDEGCLTSTTVLALAADLSSTRTAALAQLADQGRCAVSLHFATNSERGRDGWQPLSEAGRRLAEPDGTLPVSAALAEKRADPWIIAEELQAQYDRAVELGLRPIRLDSHCGTLYGLHTPPAPPLPSDPRSAATRSTATGRRPDNRGPMEVAVNFCQHHQLGFRLPRSTRLLAGPYLPPWLRRRHTAAVALADHSEVALPEESTTNPFPRGLIPNYAAMRAQYLWLLARLPEGTSEIFLHPGAETTWARRHFGRGWDKRVWEARLLRDPAWLDALDVQRIRLVTTW